MVLVTQSCPTLSCPLDYSPPGFSIKGILQARILEWVDIPFSRGSFQPRNLTWVSAWQADSSLIEMLKSVKMLSGAQSSWERRREVIPQAPKALETEPDLYFPWLLKQRPTNVLAETNNKVLS